MPTSTIPSRSETLQVLRLIGKFEPILMLTGDDEGYGTRWIIAGQQVQPAIARFLMESGFISDAGKTEFGAHRLTLTEAGKLFREKGLAWWGSLSLWQKIKITLFG
ncbi:MAG: hypothetical protein H6R15_3388 [Proteobacteria bacterium]|nr:hypothetical protein [Pseudomonadota bacterium]